MEKIKIGNSLHVTVLGLGAINFGTKINSEKAFELMDKYIEYGGNFIDTSNNYAVWNGGDGYESEKTIGKWLTARKTRNQMIIATKVGARPKDLSQKDFSNMEGLSRETIIQSVHTSLQNLQTDYIDLLYLHVDDFSVPQFEVMQTLNELIVQGLIKEIGCSNFYAWRIESARKICEENNFHFFSVIQQRYSYLTPTVDADFYPQVALNQELCSYLQYHQNLTLVAYSPLLKGQYNKETIEKKEYQTQINKERLMYLKSLKTDPNGWVINYIIHSFHKSIALLTTSNIQHLEEIMKSIQ